MEGRTLCNDVLFCPTVIEPNELLQVAEQAWTPRDPDHDPDKLKQYRFDGIVRLLAPSDDDKLYQMLEENQRHDYGFGPKSLIYRLSSSPSSPSSSSSINTSNKSASFDFQAIFPKTYGMLTNQKFRWFQYKKGVLHVICGRLGVLDANIGNLKTNKYCNVGSTSLSRSMNFCVRWKQVGSGTEQS
eukprot:scaffold6841_cov58-Attheya_sp.AAC.1